MKFKISYNSKFLLSVSLIWFFTTGLFAQVPVLIGTSKVWGRVDGVVIEGVVQGPSRQVSDLQVVCVFEYTKDDIFNSPPALPAASNGLVHLDKDMDGVFTELRKSGKFIGRLNETLLLSPPKGSIGGKHLLLIGLGNREQFSAEVMVGIGSVALREAVKLKVRNFSFASDLKDAGIDSPTALVAGNVVKGIFNAYRSDLWLKEKGLLSFMPIEKVMMLSGPAFFTTAGDGIQEAIFVIKN